MQKVKISTNGVSAVLKLKGEDLTLKDSKQNEKAKRIPFCLFRFLSRYDEKSEL